jgi:heme-degrading monooxygenase HmoA
MYANVATLPLQPGTTDQCLAILRDLVQPRLHEQQGFQGWLLLGDGTATVVSISLWATRDDLEAAGGSALVREAMAGLAPLLAGAPARQAYQVLAQTAERGQ